MRFAFWKKRDPEKLRVHCWNLMILAIDPDRCWKTASMFRSNGLPGSVLTCETAYIMGSITRKVIRDLSPRDSVMECVASAEKAYHQTFEEQSDEPMTEEMQSVYGQSTLAHVATTALAAYGRQDDELFMTASTLAMRLKGDPRTKHEIIDILQDRRDFLEGLYRKLLDNA